MSNSSYDSRSAAATDDAPRCDVFHANPAKIARVRGRLLPAEAGEALAETFKVLGDPTRVRILDALAQAELCVCDLAALVGLTESAVSHQLRLLRSMRIVRPRRDGRMVFYALDDQHILRLFEQGLRHVEENVRPASRRRRPASREDRNLAGGGRPEGAVHS